VWRRHWRLAILALVLLARPLLERIVSGEITLVFRRWLRPSVRAGGTLKTALGVLAIDSVEQVDAASLSEAEASRAGYAGRGALLAELARREGDVYRIAVRYAGADPRIALRERDELTEAEWTELGQRLARFDAASRSGPWTQATLRAIAGRPGVLAARLAKLVGQSTDVFKRNVRKLKELGLTESLEIGYRLSARGQRWVERVGLDTEDAP
jgi:hypothetical protein